MRELEWRRNLLLLIIADVYNRWVKTYVMLSPIWYHLYNFKNVKSTHGGVLHLAKLKTEAFNFTESNTFPLVFPKIFKLYKSWQIAQTISYRHFYVKYWDCAINISRSVFGITVKHLWWSFFAKVINDYKILTIFARKLHHICLLEPWIRLFELNKLLWKSWCKS